MTVISAERDCSVAMLCLAKEGDEAALASVVACLHDDVRELVRTTRLRASDMEDAVQDAFVVLLRCLHNYTPSKGSFRPYVLSSVRKNLLRFGKPGLPLRAGSDHALVPAELGVDCDQDLPNRVVDWRGIIGEADDLLSALPTRHRQVVSDFFGLMDGQELTIAQISARRELSEGTVKRALREARTLLAETTQP